MISSDPPSEPPCSLPSCSLTLGTNPNDSYDAACKPLVLELYDDGGTAAEAMCCDDDRRPT